MSWRPVHLCAALAAVVSARHAGAQSAPPPTIDACYVPASGTIYRIDTPASPAPGAPKQCLTSLHVRFGWVALGKLGGMLDLSGAAGFASETAPGAPAPSLPLSGAGTRLLWYPQKASFRAGKVSGPHWDDGLTGESSAALGENAIASGRGSFATGVGTTASGLFATAFGTNSAATREGAFAGGAGAARAAYAVAIGRDVQASGDGAVAMGQGSQATGVAAVALGGLRDGTNVTANGDASLAAGADAHAVGHHAVALGQAVVAGAGSVALGTHASASQAGTFVFSDASSPIAFGGGVNAFRVRAAGGVIFVTNAQGSAGVQLAPGGGSWQSVSDVRRKTAFQEVDGEALLGKLAATPVRTWRYRTQDASIRHMGPTAQDFRRAFGLGESDTTITSVDADGVALAAARALERRTAELRRQNVALGARADSLQSRLAALERALASVTAIHDVRRSTTATRAARRPARGGA